MIVIRSSDGKRFITVHGTVTKNPKKAAVYPNEEAAKAVCQKLDEADAQKPGLYRGQAWHVASIYGRTKKEALANIQKYKNPDSRCRYPFTPDPIGYCWSYANHVDGTKGFEDMDKICPGCDEWSGPAKKPKKKGKRK